MKYRLPRQILSRELVQVAAREVVRQEMAVSRASKEHLRELAGIAQSIESEGLDKKFVCKKLSRELGHGIFLHPSAKPLLKGQVIAPYAGTVTLAPQNQDDESSYAFDLLSDIILTKEEHALLDKKRPYHPRRLYALVLDAAKHGNFTRFINHSEQPNVDARYMKIPANGFGLVPAPLEIIYVAKKMILPGEQLLVSYEDEEESYWGPLKIKPFPMTPQTFRLAPSLQLLTE